MLDKFLASNTPRQIIKYSRYNSYESGLGPYSSELGGLSGIGAILPSDTKKAEAEPPNKTKGFYAQSWRPEAGYTNKVKAIKWKRRIRQIKPNDHEVTSLCMGNNATVYLRPNHI